MGKLKVMTIVGTRPEVVKLSRVIAELEIQTDHVLVHTGQNHDFEWQAGQYQKLQAAVLEIGLEQAIECDQRRQ